jgi:hypothetical protein
VGHFAINTTVLLIVVILLEDENLQTNLTKLVLCHSIQEEVLELLSLALEAASCQPDYVR